MHMTRVLFGCGQNSARSQIAEVLLDHLAGERYEAHSVGILLVGFCPTRSCRWCA